MVEPVMDLASTHRDPGSRLAKRFKNGFERLYVLAKDRRLSEQ